jgi:hypothetical protein
VISITKVMLTALFFAGLSERFNSCLDSGNYKSGIFSEIDRNCEYSAIGEIKYSGRKKLFYPLCFF